VVGWVGSNICNKGGTSRAHNLLESEVLKKKITCIRVLLMNEGAYYLQVYIDKYHMKKERLNRGSYTVASSVANLIYKPLVLEPGVLILVGSFQQLRRRLRNTGVENGAKLDSPTLAHPYENVPWTMLAQMSTHIVVMRPVTTMP
jgi:hypothetical protein